MAYQVGITTMPSSPLFRTVVPGRTICGDSVDLPVPDHAAQQHGAPHKPRRRERDRGGSLRVYSHRHTRSRSPIRTRSLFGLLRAHFYGGAGVLLWRGVLGEPHAKLIRLPFPDRVFADRPPVLLVLPGACALVPVVTERPHEALALLRQLLPAPHVAHLARRLPASKAHPPERGRHWCAGYQTRSRTEPLARWCVPISRRGCRNSASTAQTVALTTRARCGYLVRLTCRGVEQSGSSRGS